MKGWFMWRGGNHGISPRFKRGVWNKALSDFWCKFSESFTTEYKEIWRENLIIYQKSLKAFLQAPLHLMLDSTLCQMGTMTSNMSPSHKSTNLFQSCMKDIKKNGIDSDVAVLFSCSLGEVLRGDRIVNTLYDVSVFCGRVKLFLLLRNQ